MVPAKGEDPMTRKKRSRKSPVRRRAAKPSMPTADVATLASDIAIIPVLGA